jgi:PAS domain S-box-containing protein
MATSMTQSISWGKTKAHAHRLAEHSLRELRKAVPSAFSGRVDKAAEYLGDKISRFQIFRRAGSTYVANEQAQRIAELEDFLNKLPDMVYELRLFRENITEEEKNVILDLVGEIQRAKEKKLDEIVEKVLGQLAAYVDGTILYSNLKAEQTLGISLERLGEITMAEIIAPEYLMVTLKNAFKILSQKTQKGLEYEIFAADGRRIPVSINATLTSQQFPFVIRGVVRDVTQSKQMEKALREGEERMKATLSALPDLLFEIDAEGRIYDFHSSAKHLLYAPPEVFIGKTITEIFPPKTAAILAKAIRKAVERGKHTGTMYSLMIDGNTRWFELSIARKGGSNGKLVVLARDISRRVKAESRLKEQEIRMAKMKLANRLLTTVSDYFRNIMAGIYGEVDLVNMSLNRLERSVLGLKGRIPAIEIEALISGINELRESFAGISQSSARAVETLKNVGKFVSPAKVSNPVMTDISWLIEESIEMMEKDGENVILRKGLNLPKIQVEQDKIQSALYFFLRSAADACSKIEGAEIEVNIRSIQKGVEIIISDNGERQRDLALGVLRDPPFIHGTTFLYEEYLRLSVALKYIEGHKGSVYIKSRKEVGAIVTIRLPFKQD